MLQPRKILIVDDNPLFRESLSVLLEKHRFLVVGQTGQIQEVFGLLKEKQVDILCLDLVIPEQDTLEFMLQVKKLYPKMPIIICSSLKEEHIISQALEKGCFDYLFKPVDEMRLIQSFNRAGAA